MGNSKIVYYGETLIDLTGDTVEAAKLLKGITAHDKKGEKVTGTFEAADPYAIIGATYPEGSVCTCSNGSITLTAKDTSGKAMFVIPSAGTWTVKSVNGDQTKSEAVAITYEGQVENVEIAYGLYIFRAGRGVSEGFTMNAWYKSYGWAISEDLIVWSTQTGSGNQVWVTPTLDVSSYSTLYIDFKCTGRYSASAQKTVTIGVGPDKPSAESYSGSYVAKTDVPYSTARAVRSVDLSGITSSTLYYIKLDAFGITGEIYNIWLE